MERTATSQTTFALIGFLTAILVAFLLAATAIDALAGQWGGEAMSSGWSAVLAAGITLLIATTFAHRFSDWISGSRHRGEELEALVSCTGEIVHGRAHGLRTAEARIVDHTGKRHWVRVRAVHNATLRVGDQAFILGRAGRTLMLARPVCEDDVTTHVRFRPAPVNVASFDRQAA